MNIHPLRSLAAKLFIVMSLLVIATVVGVSVQHGISFLAYQREQVEDTLQQQAERAGSQVERVMEMMKSQVAVGLPTLIGGSSTDTNEALQRFVNASSDVVALYLFETGSDGTLIARGEAFTPLAGDARFEDKVVDKVKERLRKDLAAWVRKRAPASTGSGALIVDTFAKAVDLPVMGLGLRFQATKGAVWAVLAIWQSEIIKILPKSKAYNSMIIDTGGRVFASPAVAEMTGLRTPKSTPLTKAALGSSKPADFVPEFRDGDGKRRVGAFAKLAKYGLAVLVEQDAEAALQAVSRNALVMTLVAALFLLIAVAASWLTAKEITRGLREVADATSKIAGGDLSYQIQPRTRDEVGQLGHAVNNMAKKISELMSSQVQKARIEKELETAKIVQSTFFPRREIQRPHLFVTGFYQPASECGGDLWGHYTIDDHRELLYIADAMGHGAPAALVTAMAYSMNMTIADLLRDASMNIDSPAGILRRLNRIINDAVKGTISMTFFAAIIDLRRGILTYSNAGHNFPVIIGNDLNDPRAAKSSTKFLNARPVSLKQSSSPLGIGPESKYVDKEIELKPGDKLFLFTDGLIECSSPDGKVWGRKYLLEQIAETCRASATEMKDEILARAFTFFGTRPLVDDVTVVIAELSANWQPQHLGHDDDVAPTLALDATGENIVVPIEASAVEESGAAFDADLLPALPRTGTAAEAQGSGSAKADDGGEVGTLPEPPPQAQGAPARTKYRLKIPPRRG